MADAADPPYRRAGPPVPGRYVLRAVVVTLPVPAGGLAGVPGRRATRSPTASTTCAAIARPTRTCVHALRLTVMVAVIAVVINTVFGVGISLLLVRYDFPGKRLLTR